MRKLIATVFNYSLDGLLADEGTDFWKFCFDQPENREPDDPAHLGFLRSASAPLFDGVPKSYRLDLVSNTASSSGILELRYRRHR
jgi:hypothetical protein